MAEYDKVTDEATAVEENKQPKQNKQMKRNFNLWAALFGFLYYAYKGLWKKGLLLTSLTMIILTIIHLLFPRISLSALSTGVSVGVFGAMGNIDLNRKAEYGETMWKELPPIFHRNWAVIGLSVLIFILYMTIPSTPLPEMEDASTELVTEILTEHYQLPLEAVDVRILDEVEGVENLYNAQATLSNDLTVQISVEYFPESNYIEVFIPEEEMILLLNEI